MNVMRSERERERKRKRIEEKRYMSTTERGKIHRRKIYEVNVVDRRGESKEETDEMGERGERSRNELHLQGECGV